MTLTPEQIQENWIELMDLILISIFPLHVKKIFYHFMINTQNV
jgi:hypothetical protein